MTKRADLGVWIAGASALVVAGAVAAGLIVAGNPADVRAERIDQSRLVRMGQIAAAAQCAFTYGGEVPVDFAAMETTLRERRRAGPACDHVSLAPAETDAIAYAPMPPDRIELCANFERPSSAAQARGQAVWVNDDLGVVSAGTDFPELREPRPSAGRHCYRVRLVDQAPAAP